LGACRGGPSRRRWHGEDGTSLVEVLVAVTLLAGAFLALAQVATTGMFSLRASADRTTAIGIATQAVEAGRHVPWEELAMDGSLHAPRCGTTLTIDSNGAPSEPVLCATTGAVGTASPFWGANGAYDVETYVTAIDGFVNARRVTSVVTWTERGEQRQVRSSSVVAGVERG
jgi:Tfp pilus assembly protein PilV